MRYDKSPWSPDDADNYEKTVDEKVLGAVFITILLFCLMVFGLCLLFSQDRRSTEAVRHVEEAAVVQQHVPTPESPQPSRIDPASQQDTQQEFVQLLPTLPLSNVRVMYHASGRCGRAIQEFMEQDQFFGNSRVTAIQDRTSLPDQVSEIRSRPDRRDDAVVFQSWLQAQGIPSVVVERHRNIGTDSLLELYIPRSWESFCPIQEIQ